MQFICILFQFLSSYIFEWPKSINNVDVDVALQNMEHDWIEYQLVRIFAATKSVWGFVAGYC